MNTIWGSQGTEDLKVSRPQSNIKFIMVVVGVYQSITQPAFLIVHTIANSIGNVNFSMFVSSYVDGLVLVVHGIPYFEWKTRRQTEFEFFMKFTILPVACVPVRDGRNIGEDMIYLWEIREEGKIKIFAPPQ